MVPKGRSKYIAPSKAVHALTNYMEAINRLIDGHGIYRGIPHFYKKYALVKPSKVERTSKNTSNVYTALIDCLPSWKDWPKRSRSIVCSSDVEYTKAYSGPSQLFAGHTGATYCVFPKNGSKVAICQADDIWNSFTVINDRVVEGHMDTFNRVFAKLFYALYDGNEGRPPFLFGKARTDIEEMNGDQMKEFLEDVETDYKDPRKLSKALEAAEDTADYFDMETFVKDIRHEKIARNITWIEYFDGLFNPIDNGFKLVSIADYKPTEITQEVWTDADCLLVRMSYYDKRSKRRLGNNYRNVTDLIKKATGQEVIIR